MPTAPTQIKFQVQLGNRIYKYPVETWVDGDRLKFRFDYNKDLISEVKALKGARWDPDDKCWHIPVDEQRNTFQLSHLMGKNPYAPWDCEVDASYFNKARYNKKKGNHMPLISHQPGMAAEMYWRPSKIIAGEMGTSKTLAMILAGERKCKDYREKHGDNPRWIYVAPRGALAAVQREFLIWGAEFTPEWYTYEGMVKLINNWTPGQKAPFILTLDEASKVKNQNSQRSQAAQKFADGVRDDWKGEGRVILMSGSPAPKSPVDWYSLCEIACPGFVKEGDVNKFKRRLGIIIQKESPVDGGVYPQLLSWRDDEKKCDVCGQYWDGESHNEALALPQDPTSKTIDPSRYHPFKPSVNEVKGLYSRLTGLVSVYFKKDVLDLPDKHYRIIECKPSKSILRAASLVTHSASTTIQGLTLLRELSDGFQYKDVEDGYTSCPLCKGAKEIDHVREIPDSCPNCKNVDHEVVRDSQFDIRQFCGNHQPQTENSRIQCPTCAGMGQVKKYRREIQEVTCPKDDVLSDILDEHEDVGRIVIFAGFTGSIDRCVRLCHQAGWCVIRMDQGSVKISDPKGALIQEKDFLSMFQDDRESYPKVAFVAHPKSGGMGLTLTASPTVVYFSNTFDAEDRIQSEDRIHRTGMDLNRGATIIDLVHLPSDEKILDNLKKKRDLQALTLGDFANVLESGEEVNRS